MAVQASISASTSSAGTTPSRLRLQAQEGPERGRRPGDLVAQKSEPEWMTKFRLNALKRFERKPMLDVVRQEHARHRLRRHLLLPQAHRGQVSDWDMLPEEMKTTYEKLGIPEAERKFLAGVTRAVRVRGRVPQEPRRPRGAGHPLHRHGHGAHASTRSWCSEHFGTVIPPGDNKFAALNSRGVVGRLVHLRAAGRARRHAAAGLLPHQRGERGPVRAHADHRRRGLVGALRRGLLGAGVLDRLAALRGGRAHRQAERAHPLHDDPELVAERLQPRHQAGAGRDRGDRRVDRRQPRLEAHDEVPRGRDDRPEGARRGAVGRVRRPGPAPGRGRQDDPRRARDHLDHRLEVDLARTAAAPPTAAW